MSAYMFHLGCPQCGGELQHKTTDGEVWADRVAATAECAKCQCVVTICVEMTWKEPHRQGRHELNKLPLEPLMRYMHCDTANQLGAMTGLSRAAVQRLKNRGIPIHRADELAVMCGVHPLEVWGDDFHGLLDVEASA